ncbi:MAG TPA: AzlD domain-containing protein [Thermomicrobiales bacterium]|nr:AzlD domain-containing protein [Thermomicrobiales bacterium]
MTHLWTVLALAAGTLAMRVSGLALQDVRIPDTWERSLRYVPLALLAALVVVTLNGQPAGELGARVAALLAAAAVTYRAGRMWACIASGMAVYLLLDLI